MRNKISGLEETSVFSYKNSLSPTYHTVRPRKSQNKTQVHMRRTTLNSYM